LLDVAVHGQLVGGREEDVVVRRVAGDGRRGDRPGDGGVRNRGSGGERGKGQSARERDGIGLHGDPSGPVPLRRVGIGSQSSAGQGNSTVLNRTAVQNESEVGGPGRV